MPSPNDLIAGAVPLTLGAPATGAIAADDTLEAGEGSYNYFNAIGSVWYSYVAAGGPVTISITGSEGWDPDAAPDAGLIVFSGPAAGATTEGLSAVGNNLVTNELQTTVSFNTVANQTYYVQVTGGSQTTGNFNIAVTALSGAVITGYTDDTDTPGDNITSDHDLTITGLAAPNSLVTLYNVGADGSLAPIAGATATAGADGSWSIATGTLLDGEYRFSATATPTGGAASDPSSILQLEVTPAADVIPPDAPLALALDPGSDTGVAGNNITADTTPTITGTAEAGAIVTLYDAGGTAALGQATASADGTWAITPTAALAAGAHTLTATAMDAAGNTSVASGGLAIQITAARNPGDFPASEPGFDTAYYLASNPDVAQAGIDALTHYQNFGWQEGRDPNAFFNTDFYLNQNPDVAAAHIDPLLHYLQSGAAEGRDPSIAFDSSAYLQANPDVQAAGVNPLVHYLMFGQAEDRPVSAATPHATGPQDPLVDATFYYATYGDVAALGLDPTSHYEQYGWREGRDPNAYFDTDAYLATYSDVAAAQIDPLQHYEEFGWREGRDPGPNFDPAYYLASNPDVQAAGIDPLQHFLQHGLSEGRDPVAPA